jgi:cytochrome c553
MRILPLLLIVAAPSVWAQNATVERRLALQAQLWAASCMACHGTDGRAEGVGVPLAGRSAKELHEMLLAFKSDRRIGTIMNQHAKGYSDEELARIAAVFAAVPAK